MKALGQIVIVCLVIAALQGLAVVLAIGMVFFLIWGILFQTERTVGLLIVLGLMAALQAHPWLTIGVITVSAAIVWIANARKRRRLGPPARPVLLAKLEDPRD